MKQRRMLNPIYSSRKREIEYLLMRGMIKKIKDESFREMVRPMKKAGQGCKKDRKVRVSAISGEISSGSVRSDNIPRAKFPVEN